jgi:hypothetical protein
MEDSVFLTDKAEVPHIQFKPLKSNLFPVEAMKVFLPANPWLSPGRG